MTSYLVCGFGANIVRLCSGCFHTKHRSLQTLLWYTGYYPIFFPVIIHIHCTISHLTPYNLTIKHMILVTMVTMP